MSKLRLSLLIAFAMLSIVCARTAQAGTCGDYLDKAQHSSHETNDDMPQGPIKHPVKHCHGPRCSQSNPNPAPLPAPAPVQLRPDRQIVALLSQTQEHREFARSFLPFMLDTYSLELPSGIFHPPRMA